VHSTRSSLLRFSFSAYNYARLRLCYFSAFFLVIFFIKSPAPSQLLACYVRCVAFFVNASGRHPFHGDPFAVVAGQHDLNILQDQVDSKGNKCIAVTFYCLHTNANVFLTSTLDFAFAGSGGCQFSAFTHCA